MFTRHIYFENIGLTLLFWVFFYYFNFLPMLEWFNLDLLLFRLISSNGQLTKHSSNGSCFIIVFIQKRCCLNICLVGRLLFFALIGQHLAFVLFFALSPTGGAKRNVWLAKFLTSRHVQMLRISFYMSQRNLMIRTYGLVFS